MIEEKQKGTWEPRSKRVHLAGRGTRMNRIADFLTSFFGTSFFLGIQLLFFVVWFALNSGLWGLPPFDPYPFHLLAFILASEAIFLTIIILISQNREQEVSSMRDKLDFEINVRSEEEITKILRLLDEIRVHLGIDTVKDVELEAMKERTDLAALEKKVKKAIRR